MELENIVMQIIVNSGDARSCAFKAIESARNGNFKEAKKRLEEAKEKILLAHKFQTEILQKEASGEKVNINLIMVHAQDHLMTSMLAKELIEELVNVYKELNSYKETQDS